MHCAFTIARVSSQSETFDSNPMPPPLKAASTRARLLMLLLEGSCTSADRFLGRVTFSIFSFFRDKSIEKFAHNKKNVYLCTRKTKKRPVRPLLTTVNTAFAQRSGCSSVRLEYASGGRGVASSNLVIPTTKKTADNRKVISCFSFLHKITENPLFDVLVYKKSKPRSKPKLWTQLCFLGFLNKTNRI